MLAHDDRTIASRSFHIVLAAGALALVGSVCMGHSRFAFLTEKAHQRQFGVGMLTYAVMMPPMFFVDGAIGTGLLDRGDELALSLLFGSTAFAAYNLGGIMTMLAYLDGDADCTRAAPRRALGLSDSERAGRRCAGPGAFLRRPW